MLIIVLTYKNYASFLDICVITFSRATLNSKHANKSPCLNPFMFLGGQTDQIEAWLDTGYFQW
jgi:hypothetical protein